MEEQFCILNMFLPCLNKDIIIIIIIIIIFHFIHKSMQTKL